jgi:hypothetical protein
MPKYIGVYYQRVEGGAAGLTWAYHAVLVYGDFSGAIETLEAEPQPRP